ncbi:hypothetical protein EJB05_09950, partial [Eragrostis curvula]
MIQPVYDEFSTEVLYCKVHDMMLDLILRRCGEDNFLVALRDPQEVAEAQYKVRRLSMDMSGTEDVTMTVATASLLSQVRSLAMFGVPDWTPPLLEFKFVRVLFFEFHKHIHRLDLTCIVHLSQLHASIPSDIVDLPHLSHLSVPYNTRLPEGIGRVNSLGTLTGFNLVTSSLENVRDLGTLTKLVDMELWTEGTNSKRFLAATCALSSALEKLSNLKRISVVTPGNFGGDSLSSFSPAFTFFNLLSFLRSGDNRAKTAIGVRTEPINTLADQRGSESQLTLTTSVRVREE